MSRRSGMLRESQSVPSNMISYAAKVAAPRPEVLKERIYTRTENCHENDTPYETNGASGKMYSDRITNERRGQETNRKQPEMDYDRGRGRQNGFLDRMTLRQMSEPTGRMYSDRIIESRQRQEDGYQRSETNGQRTDVRNNRMSSRQYSDAQEDGYQRSESYYQKTDGRNNRLASRDGSEVKERRMYADRIVNGRQKLEDSYQTSESNFRRSWGDNESQSSDYESGTYSDRTSYVRQRSDVGFQRSDEYYERTHNRRFSEPVGRGYPSRNGFGSPSRPGNMYAPGGRTSVGRGRARGTTVMANPPGPVFSCLYGDRDPVSVVMEYGQTREVTVDFTDFTRSGPDHASCFHTAAIVDGVKFPDGVGSSKKIAKKEAAEKALKAIFDKGRKKLKEANFEMNNLLENDTEISHAHKIKLLTRGVLQLAEETQLVYYTKDKIAAAIVLEMHHGRFVAVGLGTGNRCILHQHIEEDGSRIVHSHAEIIARRAFIRYLYKQLERYEDRRGHHLFERNPETGKLRIRDDVKLHLYISRPPCGDASAFPTIGNGPTRLKAIRKQGQLRTIIEDGEGAIPTDSYIPAGEDGNERLRIMTCSDKICRWNALGLQGALLSHFLDPMYLDSVIIGSFSGDQREHIPRALFGRLTTGELRDTIPHPYRVNMPEIFYPHEDLHDNYNINKSRQYYVTWTFGDAGVEVIDGMTGGMVGGSNPGTTSRLSKQALYSNFKTLCQKFQRDDLVGESYKMAKHLAKDYQATKSVLYQHFESSGYGPWYSVDDNYHVDSFS